MTEIILENEQDAVAIDSEITDAMKAVVLKTLEFEGCEFDAEVSITVVDEKTIRELNREQRNIDSVTDVLSFPMLYFDENGDITDCDYEMGGDRLLLGDIVICAPRAKKQAEEFGHSFLREMAFLTVHSMLHLLGYDHVDSASDEKVMFDKQEKILELLEIKRG